MDDGLSVVAKARIIEYQRAVARQRALAAVRGALSLPDVLEAAQERVEDAEGNLHALGLDPEMALCVRISPAELEGDR